MLTCLKTFKFLFINLDNIDMKGYSTCLSFQHKTSITRLNEKGEKWITLTETSSGKDLTMWLSISDDREVWRINALSNPSSPNKSESLKLQGQNLRISDQSCQIPFQYPI